MCKQKHKNINISENKVWYDYTAGQNPDNLKVIFDVSISQSPLRNNRVALKRSI